MRNFTVAAVTAISATILASAAPAQVPPSAGGAAPFSTGSVGIKSRITLRLEANGYSHVEIIQRSPTGWNATAMKDGKFVRVAVDDHGNIMTR